MDYKQRYAILHEKEQKIQNLCKGIQNKSGIYFLTREEEGIKYAYIGASRKLINSISKISNIDKWKCEFNYTSIFNLKYAKQQLTDLYSSKGYNVLQTLT